MDIGHILSNVPPIVENIFTNLNGRDLDSCSKVCELWKRVAETEKNSREDIAWFFQGLYCPLHDKIHCSPRRCSFDIPLDIETHLSLQLKDLKLKPKFCLAFASTYCFNEFKNYFPSFDYPPASLPKRMRHEDHLGKRAYLKSVFHTALGQYLPENCRTTFCVTPGIIGCTGYSSPVEIEDGCGISGIVIPHVPGLQIYNFAIDEKHCDISQLVPKDAEVKCLLVFITPNDSSSFNRVIQSCLLKESSQIAIGGAIVDRSGCRRGSVVAFCGDSVEAASLIITPKDKKTELESKLRLFEQTGLLKDRCFAFMFACVARGFYLYSEHNVESSVFHKLYPNVPLIGIFGNGEIGVNYLPNIANQNRNEILRIGKLLRCRKKYLHSYTTIFVLVSLKL